MADDVGVTQRRFAEEYDEKSDEGDQDGTSEARHIHEDDQDGEDGSKSETDSSCGGENGFQTPAHDDLAYDCGHEDNASEDACNQGVKLCKEDEQRLLGAFLLAAEGGLDGSGNQSKGEGDEELQLPTDGPTCLKKFTTIAASLGLKTTREKLREDFEQVVRSNGLVEDTVSRPWEGAYDTHYRVTGFTYAIIQIAVGPYMGRVESGVLEGSAKHVFRRYYITKIQGELLEVNIRQAWNDLHYGTGGKRMWSEAPSSKQERSAAAVPFETSSPSPSRGVQRSRGNEAGRSNGRPYVQRAELQKVLTREGEALTDEEVDELLRECRPDDEGRIVYEGYRRMLIDPSL